MENLSDDEVSEEPLHKFNPVRLDYIKKSI